jgi:fused signal recognition particle receptor
MTSKDDGAEKSRAGLLRRLFSRPEPDPPSPAPADALAPQTGSPPVRRNWFARLASGLSRTSASIGQGIVDVVSKRRLDAAALDDLEEVLIRADLGVAAASRIREAVGRGRHDKAIEPQEVRAILAAEVERILAPVARALVVDLAKKPFVILVVGVNGSGKTTTIGKLAAKFSADGLAVTLAAGDTFRAAAIEQLRLWAAKTGAGFVAREQGADAAGLAFDAINAARADGSDVLLVDTAGRLQNRGELMGELEKVVRVMKKVDPQAPHAVLLVLDATVGQNALAQVEIFGRVAGVTGLAMTKLDGTARGGILVAIAEKFCLPVHFIGVGEKVDDLEPFAARDFADAIAGVER